MDAKLICGYRVFLVYTVDWTVCCFNIGFDALGYQEHLDYSLVQSTNPEYNKALIRVNIYRDHRQTIQVWSIYCVKYHRSNVVSFHGVKLMSNLSIRLFIYKKILCSMFAGNPNTIILCVLCVYTFRKLPDCHMIFSYINKTN